MTLLHPSQAWMGPRWQHTASAATFLILACFVSGSLPGVFAQHGSPAATGSSSGATSAHAYSPLAPNGTNACCVAFPLNISRHGYCREVKYLISAAIDPRLADRTANDSYQNDRALWQPALDCSLQIPGQSICSNCLAIRHKWHCASQFAVCTITESGFATAGPCQWYV